MAPRSRTWAPVDYIVDQVAQASRAFSSTRSARCYRVLVRGLPDTQVGVVGAKGAHRRTEGESSSSSGGEIIEGSPEIVLRRCGPRQNQ